MSIMGFFSSHSSAPPTVDAAATADPVASHGPEASHAMGSAMSSGGGFDLDESPQALDQWNNMVESGFITEQVQVRISKLLDLPRRFEGGRPVPYQILASDDEKVLGHLKRLGGRAPAEQKKETVDLTEAEGTMNLKTSSAIIILELTYDDGVSIASCSLSRMDPRSAKKNTYSLEDQHSTTAVCGVELTIVEGRQDLPADPLMQTQLPSQPSMQDTRRSNTVAPPTPPPRRGTSAPMAPEMPPVGFPPGAGSKAPPPSKAAKAAMPTPSFSLGDKGASQPVPSPPPVDWTPAPGHGRSAPISREVTIQVTQLMDMPSRPGQRYVVRVMDNLGQLAAMKQVGDPSATYAQTVLVKMEGILPLRTESYFLTVQVEFADGTPIGSCQIFRPDPRSQKSSRYLLTDSGGQSANCGIELQVFEGKSAQAHAHMGSNLEPGMRVVGRLQLRILAAFRLHDKAGTPPSAFVKAKVGQTEHRTLTVESSQNPIWSTSNMFTFPVTAMDGELELEVVNSCVKSNDVLGTLSLGLWNIPSGQWLQRREKLRGGNAGELEYSFLFEPAKVSTQVPGELLTEVPAPPMAPFFQSQRLDGPYGGAPPGWQGSQPVPLPPGSLMVGDLMLPPLMAGWEGAMGPRAPLRSLPEPPKHEPRLEEHQMLFPDMFHFDRDDHDPEELWLKPPEHSKVDSFFGADRDFEVLAVTAEKWRAPVLTPLETDVFHDKVFPDMDVSLVKAPERRKEVPVREVKTKVKERRTKGLPEVPVDGWMENKPKQQVKDEHREQRQPLRPLKDDPKDEPKETNETMQRPEGGQAKPAFVSPIMEARNRRRDAKLKVEREMVRLEQARDIEQQLQSPDMISLDPELRPEHFRAQVVSYLGHEPGNERRVWVRTATEEPLLMQVPRDSQEWLEPFQSEEMHVGLSSLPGKRGSMDPLPCQDCCSLTQFESNDVLYIVCDGHGPFGHLVAFRVAQSLPRAFEKHSAAPPEPALVDAFREASLDLAAFADASLVDISSSGCSCSVVHRRGSEVLIASLGDCRTMAAAVTDKSQRVDFVTAAHSTEDVRELQRVRNTGAKLIQVPPNSGHVRIFTPGERTPGLYTTRSLGDSTAEVLGVRREPEFQKTSFSRNSGLVLLGSGGLWEVLDHRSGHGLEAVQLLLGSGRLKECGPQWAAGTLTEELKERWQQATDGCHDDLSCILLHWSKAAGHPPEVVRISAQEAAGPAVSPATGPQARMPLAALRGAGSGLPVPCPSRLEHAELPDVALCPTTLLCQLLGDGSGTWRREPLPEQKMRLQRLDREGLMQALPEFQADCPAQVAVRQGSQDCFSITRKSGGLTVYVVCNGHGPLGKLVAFRSAQSIPKLLLEAEATDASEASSEQLLARSVKFAAAELKKFAERNGYDLRHSGASVSIVLRQGSSIHLGWLGDTRLLVATIYGEFQRVDLLSSPQLVQNEPERRRMEAQGIEVKEVAGEWQAFAPNDSVGSRLSRAIGNFALADRSHSQPDLAKTSFETSPGLVLLGGGALYATMTGEAVLQKLLDGNLKSNGTDPALQHLCETLDLACILLYWPAPADEAEMVRESEPPLSPPVPTPGPTPTPVLPHVSQAAMAAMAQAEVPTPPQPASPTKQDAMSMNCGASNRPNAQFVHRLDQALSTPTTATLRGAKAKAASAAERYAMAASKPIESFTSSMPTPQFAAVSQTQPGE